MRVTKPMLLVSNDLEGPEDLSLDFCIFGAWLLLLSAFQNHREGLGPTVVRSNFWPILVPLMIKQRVASDRPPSVFTFG